MSEETQNEAQPATESGTDNTVQTEVVVAPYLLPTARQKAAGDPPNEPLLAGDGSAKPIGVTMPSADSKTLDSFDEVVSEHAKVDKTWFELLETSQDRSTDGEGEQALSDATRDWRRAMVYNNDRIGSRDASMAMSSFSNITAANAVQAYRSAGKGIVGSNIVFWGSGVRARFSPLPNGQLHDVISSIASARITLGRQTFGIGLSAHMVYTVDTILKAARTALDHSTIKPEVDLGDALRLTDFQTLTHGLAQATFSDGFNMTRGCVASGSLCNHITQDLVLPRRMWLVDDAAISEEQRKWVAGLRQHQHSLEDLAAYQDHFPKLRSNTFDVENGNGTVYKYKLKVPTLNEYIASGTGWVDGINQAVVRSIGEEASFRERNAKMLALAKAATARQYAHWVESITIPGVDTPITDAASIAEILENGVSSDDVELTNFFRVVREYHESVMTTLIVIPNYRCAACGRHQMHVEDVMPEDEQPPLYIAVDPVNTFFALAYRKLQTIASR